MALHRKNRSTSYEFAAVNRVSGERIFVCVSPSRSRRAIQRIVFGQLSGDAADTRLARVNAMTGCTEWTWAKKAAEGIVSGDWSLRFTGRTALEADNFPLAKSIYPAKGGADV